MQQHDKSPPRGAGRAHDDAVGLPSTRSSINQAPTLSQVAAEAAVEYRKNVNRGRPSTTLAHDEFTRTMQRAFVHECLDSVPRDVAGAQFALESGDDEHAFLHLQRVILAVREAARTFNEVRKGGRQS